MSTFESAIKSGGTSANQSGQSRLLFIDNIRWTLIALVICHHSAVTYSHVGGWYYMEGPMPNATTIGLFAMFETVNQAYFMGLLFLLAGYFVPRAFDTKGFSKFLRDRAVRLGIPSLFFMLVIHPFIVYYLLRNFDDHSIPPFSQSYRPFIMSGRFLKSSGPMWFAVALLIFCAIYGLARISSLKPISAPRVPDHKAVVSLFLIMGCCSFIVRIFEPIGASVFNMQPCYFSQYVLLFLVGILAYRGNWLVSVSEKFGVFWFRLSLRIGLPGLVAIFVLGPTKGNFRPLLGGLTWQSFAFSFWEAFFCVGVCLGFIVLFRQHFNTQGPWVAWLSRNGFSAYLFHSPILVAITLWLKHFAISRGEKFVLASLIAIPVTFVLSGLIREHVPGLRRLL